MGLLVRGPAHPGRLARLDTERARTVSFFAMSHVRRASLAAAVAAAPVALAWRFALIYRIRAGFPKPEPPKATPAALDLPFESITINGPDVSLPAWFIPARDGAPGPGVLLVHGWDSARDRTLPLASVLHAAGFHCLTVDVRGHGANPPEVLPVTGGEFGADARAAFDALLARPEVTIGAISGHSMGGVGATLAAAADPRVAALVATSTPVGPYRLTRQTFHLAKLPIPDPIAYPLAWFTTRVFLHPRGHTVEEISAAAAIGRYRGPMLLAHGDADTVVPLSHLDRLVRLARRARTGAADAETVESLVVAGGGHSWLYEFTEYRSTIARFLTQALGGPLQPEEAAQIAAAVPARRLAVVEAGHPDDVEPAVDSVLLGAGITPAPGATATGTGTGATVIALADEIPPLPDPSVNPLLPFAGDA